MSGTVVGTGDPKENRLSPCLHEVSIFTEVYWNFLFIEGDSN
jgi:hypothetical protein